MAHTINRYPCKCKDHGIITVSKNLCPCFADIIKLIRI